MAPKIGIVILNWNNWQDTTSCLQALGKQAYPQSSLAFYVVDNGSQDDSPVQLKRMEGIHLTLLEENLGFARGSNIGIQAALQDGCAYVMLLNNDAYPSGDLLASLLDFFQRDRRTGIVSPKIYYANPPGVIWYAGGIFRQPRLIGDMVGMGESDRGQHDQARKVDFAVGCCMIVRREVFEAIGLLDPTFFFYFEDVDFSYRASQAGYSTWYQPAASLVHDVSSSTRNDQPKRLYLYSQSRIIFLIKHIHGFKIPLVIAMEVVRLLRTVTRHLLKGEKPLADSYIRGVISGIQIGRRRLAESG